MDPQLVRSLADGEGRGLLESLPPYDEVGAIALAERLRADGFAPELVAAALTQSRLRARAVPKFGADAARMLFTADGLEQATRPQLASRHARRFVDAGVGEVWDLGCGIGADSMALAAVVPAVHALEVDPTTVEVARANLRGRPSVRVQARRAEEVRFASPTGTGVWFDPARRVPGQRDRHGRAQRTGRLDQLAPSWETVQELACSVAAGGAKLGPGFAKAALPSGTEAQWTSFGGQVLECTVWWGAAARRVGCTAAVPRSDTEAEADPDASWVEVGPASAPTPRVGSEDQIGAYLYDPDPALVAAGLVGTLAEEVAGAELDSGTGYLTASAPVPTSLGRCFAVHDVLPLNAKALRAWARAADVGRLTIKKQRGQGPDPQLLRRQLRLRGTGEATVVLSRVAGRAVVLVVSAASGGSGAGR